ncbi:MAG: hypothetical protein JNJ77_07195 [Planctomycetia bacterium]|nr:hypothetical protein [Planctomycetia bacterium]
MNRLMTPEHLHVALNHLPLIGLAASLLPLCYGLLRKNTEVITIALCMCLLFGASTVAVMWTGEAAEDRFEKSSVLTPLDSMGKKWMAIHEDRAKIAAIAGYLAVAVCLASLVAKRYGAKYLMLGAWATSLMLVVAIILMAWVADSGGQIRHPEFRTGAHRTSALL